jgi:hypothetical protein
MMRDGQERVFSDSRIRRAGWMGVAAGTMLPWLGGILAIWVYWLLAAVVGSGLALLGALVAWLAIILFAVDYLSLGWHNRRWRTLLADKLRREHSLKFSLDEPDVYFVGLAHPAKVAPLRWETDDDIGFVRVGFDTFEYHGDRLFFDIAFDQLESVTLEPIGYGLPARFKRIRVKFKYGEPFDELLLSSREGDRLSAGNDVTLTLYEALRLRWERRNPAAARLVDETDDVALLARGAQKV